MLLKFFVVICATMASSLLISFWFLSGFVIALAGVLATVKSHLPQGLRDLLFYGKMRGKRTKWSAVQLIEVPKSWFTYFYAIGVLVNGTAVLLVANAFLNHHSLPSVIVQLLERLNSVKEVSTDALAAILLIGMMFVQNSRRLIECLLVSVYSKSTMNLIHFMLGVILYSTFFLAVLTEAPSSADVNAVLKPRLNHVCGLSLFIWASWHHHQAHVTFGQLRKNKSGEVVNYEHTIPRGGWFEYVSCPHYFMEIVIYLSFVIVGGLYHKTLLSIFFFVLSNQLAAGHFMHSWYKQQFRSYPTQRRAILPYIF